MSKQAAQEFGRSEPSRLADLRAKKKKMKEEKKEKARLNNIKRKEMGIRSASYNSGRVFSTVIPAFITGDAVTNRPVTVGQKLRKGSATSLQYGMCSMRSLVGR